jgi:hypothetical protein
MDDAPASALAESIQPGTTPEKSGPGRHLLLIVALRKAARACSSLVRARGFRERSSGSVLNGCGRDDAQIKMARSGASTALETDHVGIGKRDRDLRGLMPCHRLCLRLAARPGRQCGHRIKSLTGLPCASALPCSLSALQLVDGRPQSPYLFKFLHCGLFRRK